MTSINASRTSLPHLARVQLRAAAIYLIIGLAMGMWMAAAHTFQFRSVHAHINLLGWATLALTGLVYALVPNTATSRWARWHVVLHNLGLPVLLAALTALMAGHQSIEPLVGLAAGVTTAGLVVFCIGLWRTV